MSAGLYCFGNAQVYGVVGWAALILESFTPFPQILAIYRKQHCKGVSKFMLLLWLFGDSVKTYFYFIQGQPSQFIMGGIVQIGFDLFLWLQIFRYGTR